MGTFDVLNLRINGYQYHVDLMAHKKPWTDPGVTKVFQTWAELLPMHQDGSLGRTWQEAAQALQQKKAGMYLLGLFVTQQFPKADLDDVDFFTFPEVDSNIGADALDAPIDGYMLSKKPTNEGGAKALLGYLGSPDAGTLYAEDRSHHADRQQQGGPQLLHRAAEEGCRPGRLREERRPVPRPRHPARLRVDRHDPGAPGLHQEPRGHQRSAGPASRTRRSRSSSDPAGAGPRGSSRAARHRTTLGAHAGGADAAKCPAAGGRP